MIRDRLGQRTGTQRAVSTSGGDVDRGRGGAGDGGIRRISDPTTGRNRFGGRDRARNPGAGDEEVLRSLHDEHAPALWAHAMRLCGGDRTRAEDLVQETMLRAWRSPPDLDPHRGSVRAWLLTTARRLAIDAWRHSSVRPEIITDRPPDISVPDGIDRTLQSWLVAEALAELTPQHRAVIEECYFKERSVREAADVLGIPVGTVKSRTHYALHALRLILAERGVTA